MNSKSKLIAAFVLLQSFTACNAQIQNSKTENVKIFGNCEICEKTIETAGNIKKIAAVDWNKDTKVAIITYDSTKTNQQEILKRIALAGYDNEQFLAPTEVYANLAKCCQYERVKKKAVKAELPDQSTEVVNSNPIKNETQLVENQLKSLFDNYFALKEALVKSNSVDASINAGALNLAINAVKMEKLSHEEHLVWMKINKELANTASAIQKAKDISVQRAKFIVLSDQIYQLAKVSKQEIPVYYQHCPMANEGKGANWLSKENNIKNPYYGSQMLTCGSTIETIK